MTTDPLFYSLSVESIYREAEDTYSFAFTIPPELKQKFIYSPGQFISLKIPIQGKDVVRSYSLSSYMKKNEPFTITVKRVPQGLMSNHLIDNLQIGDKVLSSPPAGIFFKEKHLETPQDQVLLFAAGSGITPVFSMVKHFCADNRERKVQLIYSNRNDRNIIFKKELDRLQSDNPNFHWTNGLTQPEPDETSDFQGRLNTALLEKMVGPFSSSTARAYLCGPRGFMDTCSQFLQMKGMPHGNIHIESFETSSSSSQATTESATSSLHTASTTSTSVGIPSTSAITSSSSKASSTQVSAGETSSYKIICGDESPLAECTQIDVILNGQTHHVTPTKGKSLLENFIAAGIQAPYSCMDGGCMACLGKVKKGKVGQHDLYILTEDNIKDREVLTCQGLPCSQFVTIDYDEV